MAEAVVTINLGTGTSQITTLHIHVEPNSEELGIIMVGVDELNAKVTQVTTVVTTVLTNTTELVKDVQRLLTQGDTTAANAALDTVITNLTDAADKLSQVDVAVEAASPEPTTPPTTTSPADELFS